MSSAIGASQSLCGHSLRLRNSLGLIDDSSVSLFCPSSLSSCRRRCGSTRLATKAQNYLKRGLTMKQSLFSEASFHLIAPPSKWESWVSGSSAVEDTYSLPDTSEERERLKAKLLALMESIEGNLSEECMTIISELRKLNPNPAPLSTSNLYDGFYESIRATFKSTGKKGEGKKEVGYPGAKVTLGRASFNTFQPISLEISLDETFNHIYKNGEENYKVVVVFSVGNPETNVEDPIRGLLINNASYRVASSTELEVSFKSAVLAPLNPGKDLEAWKGIFAAANPEMDDDGRVAVSLPPVKGMLEFIYIDQDIRITTGNMGGTIVMRKLKDAAVFLP